MAGKDTLTAEDAEMKDPAPAADVEMKETSKDEKSTEPKSPTNTISPPNAPNPEIERLAEQLKAVLPDTFEGHPSLLFYVTFWQLSLMDVDEGGIKQQYRDAIAFFQRKLSSHSSSERRHGQESLEKRRAREEVARLTEEQDSVHKAAVLTQHHLREEMSGWFEGIPMLDSRSDALHNALLQDCFIPRSRMSVQDAQFASAMLKFMHKAGVPGFRTIKILDLLFNANKLTCIISMYTEEESKNFGRFLSDVLRELQIWHENKDNAYAKSAHGVDKNLPGFGRRFNSDRTPTELLSFEDFCMLLYKWHKALFTALKTCIESGEYMEVRNSINILKALSPTFPKVDVMAKELRQPIQNMASNDDRDDVKTAAGSILYEFQRSQKFWKSEGQFRNLPNAPPPNVGSSKPGIEKAKTPQPQDSAAAKLNVNAPAFKPKPTEANGAQKPAAEKTVEDRSASTPATSGPRSEKESNKPTGNMQKVPASTQSEKGANKPTSNAALSSAPQSTSGRPDNHNGPAPSVPSGRVSHGLPTRPDAQPRSRQLDRPGGDRQNDYAAPHGRHDNRGPPPSEYGRLDRSGDLREREVSPNRRPRPRSPDRGPMPGDRREWVPREAREYDERSLRGPPRDTRAPPGRPPTWEPRDTRDQRERIESRGHPHPPPMEPRRMHSNSIMSADEPPRRRDLSFNTHQGGERSGPLPRPPQVTTPSASDKIMINPERAALINEEQVRIDAPRPDRDNRRERSSRPQSPRRGEDRRLEERPSTYHGRNETSHHREERIPSQAYPAGRDRRDDSTNSTPTGPRGRGETAQSSRVSRDMFQPSQGSRAPGQQLQDPNYGRLNPPTETIPSGPRNPSADRRDTQSQQPSAHTPPAATAGQHGTGVHSGRMNHFRTPSIQTDVPGAPSGPRGSGRSNQGPLPSPLSRGPPTGPASADRNPRNQNDRNPLRAINSVLTQNAPTPERPNERNPPAQNPQVRGRGSIRANGPMDAPPGNMASPVATQSHPSTPNARSDGQHSRPGKTENTPSRLENTFHDEGRLDSRSHRESRRSDRSGHDHGHSREASERRPEERNTRNGLSDRNSRGDEQEKPNERERGGREKRTSERDSNRHNREREGGERSGRERRDRGSRDDGRASGRESAREAGREAANREAPREERERRNRDDGRKRGREAADQPHGELKRSRR